MQVIFFLTILICSLISNLVFAEENIDKAVESAQKAVAAYGTSEFIEEAQERAQKSFETFEHEIKPQVFNIIKQKAPESEKRKFDELDKKLMADHDIKERYYLFISSSVPLITLQRYANQCDSLFKNEKILVVMAMQGFIGGMQKIQPTFRWIKEVLYADEPNFPEIKKEKIVGIEIAPKLAKKFNIEKVPALVDISGNGCIAYGDSTLLSLIEHVKNGRCEEKIGKTYQMAEMNAIDEVQQKIALFDQAKLQEEIKNKIKSKYQNMPGRDFLPPAEEDREYTVDYVFEVPFDVPGPNPGEILYEKGFKYNPLEYAHRPTSILLFNGADPKEINWVKNELEKNELIDPATVLTILGGDYFKLTNILNRAVFRGTDIYEKKWCEATPCLVSFTPGQLFLVVNLFKIPEEKK